MYRRYISSLSSKSFEMSDAHFYLDDGEVENEFFSRSNSQTNHKSHLSDALEAMQLNKESMTILLVFPHEDAQLKALQTASRSLANGEAVVNVANTADSAANEFQAKNHDLVIIDRRSHNAFSPDAVCRNIRSCRAARHTVIVALVKSGSGGHDESSMKQLLKSGYNKRIFENTNVRYCENELLTIEHNDVVNAERLTAANAVLAALEKVQEAVEITDGNYKIEYVNPAHEKLFGYNHQDLLGHDMRAIFSSDKNGEDLFEGVQTKLLRGKTWEGFSYSKGKSGISLRHRSTITPVYGKGGKLRHLVSVKSISDGSNMTSMKEVDSFNSSINRRRESAARIHSMTIEAPITQVISIINAAQAASTPTVAQALDKVLDLLQSTDLYAAINRTGREDKMTSDLIEGLMTSAKMMNDKIEKRRFSIEPGFGSMKRLSRAHDSTHENARQAIESQHQQIHQHTLTEIPDGVVAALEGEDEWNYDILYLERVSSNRRVLVYLSMKIFERFGVMQYLNCAEGVMRNWLHLIEDNYHASNRYHNASHAADVTQSSSIFLDRSRIKDLFDDIDEVASLLAAVVHDLDHPGKTNPYLINSNHRLATLYNDVAVLENHHVSKAFQLTQQGDHVNIFKHVDKETYRSLRQNIIDIVLATEMAKHFEHLSRFVTNITKPLLELQDASEGSNNSSPTHETAPYTDDELMITFGTPENRGIIKRMLIKCSDVSNPCRPFHICEEWGQRIAEEYFAQTDEEKRRELPVVMPMFDRTTCVIPQSQISFIDYFIKDMFEAWSTFCDVPECQENLKTNYEKWKELLAEVNAKDKENEKAS